jgi:hypothetical protein
MDDPRDTRLYGQSAGVTARTECAYVGSVIASVTRDDLAAACIEFDDLNGISAAKGEEGLLEVR